MKTVLVVLEEGVDSKQSIVEKLVRKSLMKKMYPCYYPTNRSLKALIKIQNSAASIEKRKA